MGVFGRSPQRKRRFHLRFGLFVVFIPHNSLIHFDFRYDSIKLDKWNANKGVLANHGERMETDRRRDGQRGQGDREIDTTETDSLRPTQTLSGL